MQLGEEVRFLVKRRHPAAREGGGWAVDCRQKQAATSLPSQNLRHFRGEGAHL